MSNFENRNKADESRPPTGDISSTDGSLSSHSFNADSEFLLQGTLRPVIGDRLLSEEESQQIVDNAWTFIDMALDRGSREHIELPRMIGIEIEAALTHRDGSYAIGSAVPILEELNSDVWHKEAGSGTVEFASHPYTVEPGVLTRLSADTLREFYRLARLANSEELLVVGTGLIPVLGADQANDPAMVVPSEDEKAIAELWAKNDRNAPADSLKKRRSITLHHEDSAYDMTTNASAWITINALHVTFQSRNHDDAFHLFNGLRALTPLMMGISANTGSLNGKPLIFQDYRPIIIGGSASLEYNFRTCTGMVMSKARDLRHAFELTMPRTLSSECAMIPLKSGETQSLRDAFESVREIIFPSIQLRFHPKVPGVILVEYRPMSVQLSVEENLAVTTLLTLAADYAATHPELTHHLVRSEFSREIMEALTHGMHATITCPIGARRGSRGSVAELAEELVEVLSTYGVQKGIVNEDDLSYMDRLKERIASRHTNATLLQRDIDRYGLGQALARNQMLPDVHALRMHKRL